MTWGLFLWIFGVLVLVLFSKGLLYVWRDFFRELLKNRGEQMNVRNWKYGYEENGVPSVPWNIITNRTGRESCQNCGSDLKRRFFKKIGCIQPKCPNYYKKRKR
jgi:hypothetical protein